MDYNLIIPVVYKDYSFLRKTLRFVQKNLSATKIFILTDGRMAKYLSKEIRNSPIYQIVDENSLLGGLTYQKIYQIIKSQGREHTNTGWFFQQFLKLGFALSEYCDTEYYLSWDADTIPVRPLDFFSDSGHPYFTMKTEHHRPYFEAIHKLLGLEKSNPRSYIAEHMMFNRNVMREMLGRIDQADVKGCVWYEKIMNAVVPEIVSTDSFSEFETYGTYCKTYYPNLYLERQIPSYRLGGLIQGRFVSDRILRRLAADAYVVSFEIYDRPPFPWGNICAWQEKWLKHKEQWLKSWQ
jgi:hypothetical protein